MIHNKPPLRIYYSRVKMVAWALWWAALVALAVWMLLDPTMLQNSTDRLIAGLWIALVGALLLLTLYGVLTPLPLLVVDEHGLTCQPLPWVRRTFAWADVADVTAVKDTTWSTHGPYVTLTLEFHLKPYAVAAFGNKPQVKLGISPLVLPMDAEELVGRLRGYHAVDYHVLGSSRHLTCNLWSLRAQEQEGDRHLKAPSAPAVAREGLRHNPVLVHEARWTALDWAMLVSLALGIALDVAAARLQRGWTTAALADAIVGSYLLALALRPGWRFVLVRLLLFGAVAGVVELATDAAGERFAHSLVYPPGAPTLWASPAYMPLSWAIVLTQLGYLAWRLRGLMRLPLAMALCGLWAGANIPFYEEMAYHARWWRYAPAPSLGHTPLYVILFEALIGASLPILLRAVDRRSWRAVAFVGLVEGGWMATAALVAWLLTGR